jgi:cobalt-zinc-cadmium efflux system membrane fusion protein
MQPFRPRTNSASSLYLPLLFLFVGCGQIAKPAKSDDNASMVHEGSRVTVPTSSPFASRLQVEAAQPTIIHHQVSAPASVEADPARYARILPPLNGRVLQLFVHPGDSVTKGQELLAIDAPDFVGAQTDYAKARSLLAQAERGVTRQEDLAAHGIIGQRDVDQARTDRDSALSDFNRTKDRLRLLGMDPEKTKLGAPLAVRSPVSGKVLDVLTATGEFRKSASRCGSRRYPPVPPRAHDGHRCGTRTSPCRTDP